MRTLLSLAAVGMLAANSAFAAAGSRPAKAGAKPVATPGWLVVEEDFFYPLRFDAAEALHLARVHYRQSEERDAANQIDKAVSWLRFAAGHGYEVTQQDLTTAADNLEQLAKDVRNGDISAAARLDPAVAKAQHALATWHYFKADEALAHQDLGRAAMDLQTAAIYLQNAADSAHYEYGDGLITVFDSIRKDGKTTTESRTYDVDHLATNLRAIKAEIGKLGESLNKAAK